LTLARQHGTVPQRCSLRMSDKSAEHGSEFFCLRRVGDFLGAPYPEQVIFASERLLYLTTPKMAVSGSNSHETSLSTTLRDQDVFYRQVLGVLSCGCSAHIPCMGFVESRLSRQATPLPKQRLRGMVQINGTIPDLYFVCTNNPFTSTPQSK